MKQQTEGEAHNEFLQIAIGEVKGGRRCAVKQ